MTYNEERKKNMNNWHWQNSAKNKIKSRNSIRLSQWFSVFLFHSRIGYQTLAYCNGRMTNTFYKWNHVDFAMWTCDVTHKQNTHTEKNETHLKQSNNNCIVSTAFINPFPLNVNWMILNTDRWFHFECFVLKRKEWLSFTCLIICSHLLNRLNLFTIRQNGWRS